MTNGIHPGFSVRYFQQKEDFDNDGRPVVAVVVALWSPELSYVTAQFIHDLTMQAVNTIREQGGRPLVIDSSAPTLQERGTSWQDNVDAFVFLGGADVHPGFYSDVDLAQEIPWIDAKADKFCLDSINRAVEEDRPLLGICRGSQLLNVSQGGTLVEHIDGHRVDLGDGNMGFMDEKVELVPESKIAKILGDAGTIGVRSSHHQTVDTPGDSMTVTAYAHDNSIEAIEHTGKQWVIGLQWHPEEASANEEHRRKIFGSLITQAKQQAVKRAFQEPALQQ
ncbi:gamma-glutamyl-gamma-aminobutyrate hydrolase family protein [Enteractinococcus coprophilus]|uniref:Putative glutamine amidotransferase n=1 Tax=Enteractinococcus coprophilus TaxID=1027633 RepID=A0A543AN77_9MICC|nr:gamma-glutamyl-gamma-aminobutyrate hydrolase family protein [Enteractinococcus coprophilus]TQL74037.1 putative glutamine amidotransferase [Enteractinococcus coprophilus]